MIMYSYNAELEEHIGGEIRSTLPDTLGNDVTLGGHRGLAYSTERVNYVSLEKLEISRLPVTSEGMPWKIPTIPWWYRTSIIAAHLCVLSVSFFLVRVPFLPPCFYTCRIRCRRLLFDGGHDKSTVSRDAFPKCQRERNAVRWTGRKPKLRRFCCDGYDLSSLNADILPSRRHTFCQTNSSMRCRRLRMFCVQNVRYVASLWIATLVTHSGSFYFCHCKKKTFLLRIW